jgi:adenylate cyclase
MQLFLLAVYDCEVALWESGRYFCNRSGGYIQNKGVFGMVRDENKNLVVMFADITGSTSLYEQRGDREALQLISECLAILSDVTSQCGGTHIKTIGDEIMSTFPTPDDAARAAILMQERYQYNILSIKIGFHFGPVIADKDDVFGDAVNVAARMASLAKRDEIITTGMTVQHFTAAFENNVRHLDTATVKGKAELIPIYQLIWQDEDLTIMPADMNATHADNDVVRLTLQQAGQEFILLTTTSAFTIGRDVSNSLVVARNSVSRTHAKLEFIRGRFLYLDQSSNGTYIVSDDEPNNPIFAKRETINLTGSGYMYLGYKPELGKDDAIRYLIGSA